MRAVVKRLALADQQYSALQSLITVIYSCTILAMVSTGGVTMEWTQTALGFGVITGLLGSSALWGIAGFHLRARIERGIRREYRELFGACRRSMAQANEYAAEVEPLEARKTTTYRRRLSVPPPPPPRVHRALTMEHDLTQLARTLRPEEVTGV